LQIWVMTSSDETSLQSEAPLQLKPVAAEGIEVYKSA
jgi:hypothetical protein